MPFTETPAAFTWENLNDTWATLDDTWLGNYDVSTRIELGFLNGFTLGDSELGVLGVGELTGEIEYVDVTPQTTDLTTNRGRSRDLQRTNAGTLDAAFLNEDRRFDPLNQQSNLIRYTLPRKPVRVFVDGLHVFTGTIDDWDYSYSMGGQSSANITASDAFSLFARETIAEETVQQEASGSRVADILNELTIPWPADRRDLDEGNAILADGTADGNVLSYLQTVESSEAGLLFITKGGDVAFRERLLQPVSTALQFSDNGSGISYNNISILYGTELLANEVTVTSAEGTATASDAASQAAYGVTASNLDTLLASGSLQSLANYVLQRYKNPEYRVENITVNLLDLDTQQRADVLSLELGVQADVIFTPNQIGSPVSLRNKIIGLAHDIGVDFHNVTISFEALGLVFFVLDDDVFGKLDNEAGVLG